MSIWRWPEGLEVCDHREAGCHENCGQPDPDCEDRWHIERDHPDKECPTCGYRVGGDDEGGPWPDDVSLNAAVAAEEASWNG